MPSQNIIVFTVTLLCVSGALCYDGKESWGYANVRNNGFMFWWLYYADTQDQNYVNYPLIIWLQGGPGASSTGFGNFMEIGPLDVNLQPRNTSWVKLANILFIDNPVGTGFSYVTNTTGLAKNNSEIADDLLVVLSNFLAKLPEFQKIPVYVFSESYGGKMAATFSVSLYKAIKAEKISCDFRGVALGDSWISPYDSVATWAEYLFSMSLVDNIGLEAVNKIAKKVKKAVEAGQYLNATNLYSAAQDLVEKYTNKVDWYNILKDEGSSNFSSVPTLSKSHNLYNMFKRQVAKLYADPLATLMNGKIKDQLRIIPKNITWGGQSPQVFDSLKEDFMKPVIEAVETLLNETNLSVNVYTGQLDLIVDTIGTMNWIEGMHWAGLKRFAVASRKPIVLSENRTGGFVKSFKNFSVYWILKSGHMVPADAGITALKMVEMIIGSK